MTFKSNIMRFSVFLCFILLSVASQALAQSQLFRHITPRDGLPSGFIWTMTQDSKGFIWMGTNNGLAKHDGYSTTGYRNDPQDSTSISAGMVYDIIEYDETTFFIATDGGLNIFDPANEEFELFSLSDLIPETGSVWDLLMLGDNSMWMGASTGIFHVNPTTLESNSPDVEFYPLPGLQENQNANVTALATDSLNTLWVGTDSTLFKFDLQTNTFTDINAISSDAVNIIQGNIWSMLYTSGNDLLISSTTGLASLKDGETEIKEVKQLGDYDTQDLRSASFQTISEDPDGKIWLSTGLIGAIHWDPETGEAESYRSSSDNDNTIASDDVHLAFEDREGNTWFGYHYEGASIMYGDSWNYTTHLPFPDLYPSNPKNALGHSYMDSMGRIWATTPNGLIKNLGSGDQAYFEFDPSQFDSVNEDEIFAKILFSHNDKLFLVSQGSSFKSSFIVFDESGEVPSFSIIDIPKGYQMTAGLNFRYGEDFYSPLYNSTSLVRMNVNTMELDLIELAPSPTYPDAGILITGPSSIAGSTMYAGIFYLGTSQGTLIEWYTIDLKTGEVQPRDFTLPPINNLQPPISSTYEPGVKYMNTLSGFFRVNHPESNYNIMFEDQTSLLYEGSTLMTEDLEGYVWLSNLTGLTRLDPLTESIEFFEVPRDEYAAVRAWPATLANGEIIFPGNGSYIRFNPADLSSTQPAGETLVTSLRAGTEVFELVYSSISPEIESAQNTLTFNFLGLDMRDPASINYRYRILGSENEQWTQVGTQRSVFVPNLFAGDYTFEVQSGSQFGSFNDQTASLSFSVLPPWWNTIPAYIMYVFLLGGFIFGADRMQRRRLIQKERERSREKELAQAREIEKAYENLKDAQDQLVQQEKLASLGQLTAGIAHEIKNPLNFVNNFSELSVELVEEAREELRRGTGDGGRKNSPLEGSAEAERRRGVSSEGSSNKDENVSTSDEEPTLLLEILDDIEANLKTIHKHGSRADSIVKSMLQHSRGGSGEMEPADLNGIIKEYVNLSFHGMRAGKEPINVDIDLQLDESIGEVPLIAEDFSRVILNLTNNAFDAMAEKTLQGFQTLGGLEDYHPKLTIRTHQTEKTVTVEVEDNGPGISQDIKDKILQPFFTTKKGTSGTGLGLSITNDIIKAHGGTLEIESIHGELTRFKIVILKN